MNKFAASAPDAYRATEALAEARRKKEEALKDIFQRIKQSLQELSPVSAQTPSKAHQPLDAHHQASMSLGSDSMLISEISTALPSSAPCSPLREAKPSPVPSQTPIIRNVALQGKGVQPCSSRTHISPPPSASVVPGLPDIIVERMYYVGFSSPPHAPIPRLARSPNPPARSWDGPNNAQWPNAHFEVNGPGVPWALQPSTTVAAELPSPARSSSSTHSPILDTTLDELEDLQDILDSRSSSHVASHRGGEERETGDAGLLCEEHPTSLLQGEPRFVPDASPQEAHASDDDGQLISGSLEMEEIPTLLDKESGSANVEGDQRSSPMDPWVVAGVESRMISPPLIVAHRPPSAGLMSDESDEYAPLRRAHSAPLLRRVRSRSPPSNPWYQPSGIRITQSANAKVKSTSKGMAQPVAKKQSHVEGARQAAAPKGKLKQAAGQWVDLKSQWTKYYNEMKRRDQKTPPILKERGRQPYQLRQGLQPRMRAGSQGPVPIYRRDPSPSTSSRAERKVTRAPSPSPTNQVQSQPDIEGDTAQSSKTQTSKAKEANPKKAPSSTAKSPWDQFYENLRRCQQEAAVAAMKGKLLSQEDIDQLLGVDKLAVSMKKKAKAQAALAKKKDQPNPPLSPSPQIVPRESPSPSLIRTGISSSTSYVMTQKNVKEPETKPVQRKASFPASKADNANTKSTPSNTAKHPEHPHRSPGLVIHQNVTPQKSRPPPPSPKKRPVRKTSPPKTPPKVQRSEPPSSPRTAARSPEKDAAPQSPKPKPQPVPSNQPPPSVVTKVEVEEDPIPPTVVNDRPVPPIPDAQRSDLSLKSVEDWCSSFAKDFDRTASHLKQARGIPMEMLEQIIWSLGTQLQAGQQSAYTELARSLGVTPKFSSGSGKVDPKETDASSYDKAGFKEADISGISGYDSGAGKAESKEMDVSGYDSEAGKAESKEVDISGYDPEFLQRCIDEWCESFMDNFALAAEYLKKVDKMPTALRQQILNKLRVVLPEEMQNDVDGLAVAMGLPIPPRIASPIPSLTKGINIDEIEPEVLQLFVDEWCDSFAEDFAMASENLKKVDKMPVALRQRIVQQLKIQLPKGQHRDVDALAVALGVPVEATLPRKEAVSHVSSGPSSPSRTKVAGQDDVEQLIDEWCASFMDNFQKTSMDLVKVAGIMPLPMRMQIVQQLWVTLSDDQQQDVDDLAEMLGVTRALNNLAPTTDEVLDAFTPEVLKELVDRWCIAFSEDFEISAKNLVKAVDMPMAIRQRIVHQLRVTLDEDEHSSINNLSKALGIRNE